MKRNYKILIIGLVFAIASCSFTTKNFENDNKDKLLIDLISYVLSKAHYDAKDIDDNFSKAVFNDYINALDPLKRYFLASDIEEFKAYEDQIDDQVNNLEVSFFSLTHERLVERMKDAKAFYPELLEKPFNFNEDETINTDYDNLPYATSKEELKDRWRKQLKFSTLSTYLEKQEDQERSEDEVAKTDEELEVEAREVTRTSYQEYFDFNDDLERKDWFSIYINAIVEEFDPHSFYFAPSDKDRFDIQMSGKLEGIGARLQRKSDNIKIVEIISGGPAWRGEEIEVGDQILKVKQEDEKEPVSIVGMRLDDAVSLIKGPKGTKVVLTVKKVDGTIEDIAIIRDVVELEETYAKSAIVDKDEQRFGVINLPKFYFDMQNYKERNAAKDVKEEIIRLKKEGMEGLVLDLRNNGGGSLQTVVDIAGMFIEEGPVVQVKTKEAGQEVLKDKDKSILWDGPLVILVNELSASASEILAAAMQDYKRAIIIGSKQTYGKGTVQNVMDLNRWLRQNEYGDMGALKVTTQKFYRVNGGSTQLEGVKSDVVVVDRYSFIDIGEKDLENPLPWDKIDSADYTPWEGYIDFEETISSSKDRMAANEQLKLIEENAKWVSAQREDNEFSLNYSTYKAEVEKDEAEAKKYDAISKYKSDLTYKSLPYEEELFVNDTILKEKRSRWHENLSKDVYMEEAISVLKDLKLNNIKRSKVANIKN
ncbi:carboxy terminal-processing peptidase [Croceibacter atlanticus]|jgi:carboxyl-terminal processing protease|uniref:Probable periplasmic tail-specific proteinase n=1 Tax=Croceibacter atlanticus (strain ATCC BAA-628 / JCM 21780 / CIP 108009 / IAM 15332 / KCTC 12090 / HTCC2559) TaxID=216432 RepID=A3U740_CROAH|nr:carboxy terminal-processing peptidase [Croceibacter atlanticus]EAP88057.1 probable periplasmic tail-specific proteinase [Croceibacter atlanticus HTCC2559]|tara:strand:+ start:1430 stop:3550 length:2121 start_codon:yes stop_codon:yes gene_type:complete